MKLSASRSSPAKEQRKAEVKSHICPPSDAKHPSDRWETAFVYAFITKFTNLRTKIEGFECPADLEEAILSPTQHPTLVHILTRFVLNLRPQTRNLNPDQLSTTLSSVLQEYMKPPERTVFWDEEKQMNVDPLHGVQGGIWGADWDVKLRVLRQLVELQLVHNPDIKGVIDRAWGVAHNKHRKKDGLSAPPDPSDPHSMEQLVTEPLGQDSMRRRYWAFDDSPCLYSSTNPWKVTSEFKSVAHTKDDYVKLIGDLKARASEKSKRLNKFEIAHNNLIKVLESRLEAIDVELARVQKVRRKIEQKEILKAQAELRSTRTRRQTRRPDYVYHQDLGSDDDGDDYSYQEDGGEGGDAYSDEDEFADEFGEPIGRRRSQRTSTRNTNGKRYSDASNEWRGERRSSRLGGSNEILTDGPSVKRARTEERSVSSAPSDTLVSPVLSSSGGLPKKHGAAAVRPNEIAVEQLAGKKRSKFWYYAVEPAAEGEEATALDSVKVVEVRPPDIAKPTLNGHTNGNAHEKISTGQNGDNGIYHQSSQSPSMVSE